MSFKITDKVKWVGKIDWELRKFQQTRVLPTTHTW
jgi:flavorubredoxin